MSTPAALRRRLLDLARASIEHGLDRHEAIPVAPQEWPQNLREKRATFVTLHLEDRLRGCIGTLDPTRPLVEDIAANAFAAAFRDPRFDGVTRLDLPGLSIHVAILSTMEPVPAPTEADLIRLLRPGVDGVVLKEGHRRGTFLPAVWDDLPDARDFLVQLKDKAGFPEDYWSDTVRVYRYTTEEF